jgi:D-lactate dehydrogenase
MNITFYGLWSEMRPSVLNALPDTNVTIHSGKIIPENLDPKTEILAAFVETPITAEILNTLPNLKLIASMSTGYDHIDLEATAKRGITVCNVPTYGDVTVAEHTMALILALTRKLFSSIKRVKEGKYDFHGLRGMDLEHKTLGVIGTGKIGRQLIKRAKAFDMNVVAYDAFPNTAAAQELGFSYIELPKLLEQSDIISLHAPLLPSTEHLINKDNIKHIKKGAYLINTARGALVDPEALIMALQEGILAGAGLDVLEGEHLIQNEEHLISGDVSPQDLRLSLLNKMIIENQNVIITPHNAFNSNEAIQRIIDTTLTNIKRFCTGKPENIVKLS